MANGLIHSRGQGKLNANGLDVNVTANDILFTPELHCDMLCGFALDKRSLMILIPI